MERLGIGIVGTGNIAGAYATDIGRYAHLRLIAATDLDPARLAAFGRTHAVRTHATLDDLLDDAEVDIVVNLTAHHAHFAVTQRALDAGRHVYSEKPLAMQPEEARTLLALAEARGVRLGCSPATFLGEAQQTAAGLVRSGRLGAVRAVYAEVNHGRIESWHPAPVGFYEVGVMVDVGVYPLTLATSMLGAARSVRAWGWDLLSERVTLGGERFRIGSPDLIVAAIELASGAVMRLTTSFYVGAPAPQRGTMEFYGDDASLVLGNFQEFDTTVDTGEVAGSLRPVPLVRPAERAAAWGRGVADMAAGILGGRPHRASAEQAAHVVDILAAIAESRRHDGRRIPVSSTFPLPELVDWTAL